MSDALATWILTGLLVFAAIMIGMLAWQVFMFRREIRERGWQVDTTRRKKPPKVDADATVYTWTDYAGKGGD